MVVPRNGLHVFTAMRKSFLRAAGFAARFLIDIVEPCR